MSTEMRSIDQIVTYWICAEAVHGFEHEEEISLSQLAEVGIPICREYDCINFDEEMILERGVLDSLNVHERTLFELAISD